MDHNKVQITRYKINNQTHKCIDCRPICLPNLSGMHPKTKQFTTQKNKRSTISLRYGQFQPTPTPNYDAISKGQGLGVIGCDWQVLVPLHCFMFLFLLGKLIKSCKWIAHPATQAKTASKSTTGNASGLFGSHQWMTKAHIVWAGWRQEKEYCTYLTRWWCGKKGVF